MVNKNKLYSWLIAISILLAPLNLFSKWLENDAYLNGLFSDYLLAKIWLAEIPIILILFLWSFELIKKKTINFSKNKLIIFLISIIFIRQLFSENFLISIITFLRFSELIIFGLFLKEKTKILNKKIINIALIISLFFQIFLANTQFFLQRNVFDYPIFGETKLSASINIAKASFKQGLVITPYGSTAHSNILAGFLVIISIIVLRRTKNNLFGWTVVALTSWTLFLTQSYSGIISFAVFLTLQSRSLKKILSYKLFFSTAILIPIGLFFIDQKQELISIKRRVFLNQQAFEIWFKNILLGTGLNNFLYHLEIKAASEPIRFMQPAHNTFMLWIAETGIFGIALIMKIWNWLKKNIPLETLFILLPMLSLDHYFLTQWIGGWLLVAMVFL